MSQQTIKDIFNFAKDGWGVITFASTVFGPSSTFFLPVVGAHIGSSIFLSSVFSIFSIVLLYKTFWKKQKSVACWSACIPLFSAIILLGIYYFLFDFLPGTRLPVHYPNLTKYIFSLVFGSIFGFLTATFALLRLCGSSSA